MSKIQTSLKEPRLDNRLLDGRGPTFERLQRSDGGYVVGDTGVISLRAQQSPIERAVARGQISRQHGGTADKFYRHWRRGGCIPLNTTWKSEAAPIGKGARDLLASCEQHANDRNQICLALAAIHRDMDKCGQSLTAIQMLFWVVCQQISIEGAAEIIWPAWGNNKRNDVGFDRLRSALRVLTIEWGL